MKHELKVNVPEGLKERVDRAKQHLKDNRTTYLVGAGCLAVGYFLRKPQTIKVISNGAAPVFNNMNMPTFNNTVNNGGHMRKIVRCLETGEMWPSVTEAAVKNNTTLSYMSRHLHGYKNDVHGLHYVIEALATT